VGDKNRPPAGRPAPKRHSLRVGHRQPWLGHTRHHGKLNLALFYALLLTAVTQLDGGRHFYPVAFLKELCAYISYFKQNTFHLHLSDNLFTNPDYTPEELQNLYAGFRLHSDAADLQGLAKRLNETYTRSEFDDLQQSCASRGVTIIPEIEAPGHALVITQWKPELAISSDHSLLNITFPDTIPTMKRIWQEFLPWFHSKSVHIGADEYDSTLADDYNLFVNTMSSFIFQESGKDIRIWGTNEPGKHSNVSTNITIQHWDFSDDNPFFTLIDKGYRVINSDDSFYIVAGFSGSFPQSLNLTRIFHGDPSVPGGGPFSPNVFDVHNATNNPPRSNPSVLGHIAAQWNDFGPNATTVLEVYYDWRDGLPALADKQWGGNLSQQAYGSLITAFQGDQGGKVVIPGQNLDRAIKTKTSTILQYDFADADVVRDGSGAVTTVRDRSGNGYDAKVTGATVSNGTISFTGNNSFLTTPLNSKGFNYTLSFSIRPTAPNAGQGIGTIFSSNDSQLLNGPPGSTSVAPFHNLTLFTAGNYYSLNYSLPTSVWTKVTLSGRSDFTTTLTAESANSNPVEMRFLATIGINGQRKVWKDIPIVAPLTKIGGFVGQMMNISLTNGA
jgi:hexosaminidase